MPDTSSSWISTWLFLLLVLLLLANGIMLLVLWLRKPDDAFSSNHHSLRQELSASIAQGNERLERELRRELAETTRNARQEQAQAFCHFT